MTVRLVGALPRYTPATLNRPAGMFVDHADKYRLDPPYQRQSMWGPTQRRALIKSLQMGLPVGGVWTNEPADPMEPYNVIDGRQRIETLRAWMDDEFDVPAGWFDAADLGEPTGWGDDAYVSWSGLSERGRRHCRMGWTIGEHQVKRLSLRQEAELYLLINFGGTPQTGDDRARAERIAEGTQ